MGNEANEAGLPAEVLTLLDGRRLEEKIGETILLCAADDDGWPRLALLSVGEVVASSARDVRLVLYANSRTTAALAASGMGLLALVVGGAAYKVALKAEEVAVAGGEGGVHRWFRGEVVAVDRDEVGYARICNGIVFELTDEASVVPRWERQVRLLRDPAFS